MRDLKVEWEDTTPLQLAGHTDVGDGMATKITVHRWHAIGGSAVVQLGPTDVGGERVVPLLYSLQKILGTQFQINGLPCGRFLRNRIAVVPGEVDAWVLQSHIDVVTADLLFTEAGRDAWADMAKEPV